MAEATVYVVEHVDATPVVASSVWVRAEVGIIPAATESTILSYTAPAGGVFLDEVIASGEWSGQYRLYVDGAHKETRRTESAAPNAVFGVSTPVKIDAGQVVSVRVLHYDTGNTYAFEATLRGHT